VSILCGLLSPEYVENLDASIFMKFHMVLDLVYPKIFTREITVYHGNTNQHKLSVICCLYKVTQKAKLHTAKVEAVALG
jgi:hypothetical protein